MEFNQNTTKYLFRNVAFWLKTLKRTDCFWITEYMTYISLMHLFTKETEISVSECSLLNFWITRQKVCWYTYHLTTTPCYLDIKFQMVFLKQWMPCLVYEFSLECGSWPEMSSDPRKSLDHRDTSLDIKTVISKVLIPVSISRLKIW